MFNIKKIQCVRSMLLQRGNATRYLMGVINVKE